MKLSVPCAQPMLNEYLFISGLTLVMKPVQVGVVSALTAVSLCWLCGLRMWSMLALNSRQSQGWS